jgi:hypothetical protein
MSAFTAKVYQAGKAPKRISLLGDKARPESAQHVIEFPGGAIELTRTTDGNYWAHIIVNRGDVVDDAEGRVSALGEIVGSRIGRSHPDGVEDIDRSDSIEQIAVLIRPTKAA